jgi:hypothetical protein
MLGLDGRAAPVTGTTGGIGGAMVVSGEPVD